ncbi:hypothetical protein GA0115240_14377 [Streptomyces sp. DvalAA-14]|nr:hypothetical protein GA0115240_14377 [Streptomyces sp. DvalAA-14]
MAACEALPPDRSTGIWPMPRKKAAVSRPLMPGPVKYSALARKVIRRCRTVGITKWSAKDRWLPAMMAGPLSGTWSRPSIRGRKNSRSSGPSSTYLSTR